jgi:hypothetical protein
VVKIDRESLSESVFMCERCEKKFLKKKISPGGVNEAGLMERMEMLPPQNLLDVRHVGVAASRINSNKSIAPFED